LVACPICQENVVAGSSKSNDSLKKIMKTHFEKKHPEVMKPANGVYHCPLTMVDGKTGTKKPCDSRLGNKKGLVDHLYRRSVGHGKKI